MGAPRQQQRNGGGMRAWLAAGALLVVVGAVVGLMLARAAPPQKPRERLIGSWQEMRRGSVVEFRADGTVYIDQKHTYNYEVLGERGLKMTALAGHGHEEEPAGEAEAEEQPEVVEAQFVIADDVLTVTPNGGRADSFRRIEQ